MPNWNMGDKARARVGGARAILPAAHPANAGLRKISGFFEKPPK